MDYITNALWILPALPLLAGLIGMLMPSPRLVLAAAVTGVLIVSAVDFMAIILVFRDGPLASNGDWFRLDALAAYHLAVMMVVFLLSTFYAASYFRNEPEALRLTTGLARRFSGLWHGAISAMTTVLVSNNLGIMWVGVEATTLLTAFLICLHITAVSLEATWKYLIVCSVGVAFAFMGVLLLAASAGTPAPGAPILQWTYLRGIAGALDPRLVKLSFIFLLVGYGTKAGIAPIHSWLPDAHSQAPAPVSAFFSGFMLNMALYCIMRHLPIVKVATADSAWADNLLVFFGLLSMLIASVFILSQRDLKRFMAYCSIEHIGIIMFGLGLGPLGVFAALYHTLNHALCKTLGFFSAGRIGQIFATHDMRRINGAVRASPLWGGGLFISMLALIGVAPFAIFMSELVILKAAADSRRYIAIVLFLLGAGAVFVGALRHAIDMAWGGDDSTTGSSSDGLADKVIVILPIAALLILGVRLPGFLRHALEMAAGIVTGGGL